MDEIQEANPAAPPVVVVVEDQIELREVLLATLSEEGYDVLSAVDVPAAADLLRTRPVDLLITDVGNRSDDRPDAVADLSMEFPELATVVVSGEAGPAGIFLGPWDTEGLRRTVRKPYKLSDLLAAAREAIGVRPEEVEPEEVEPEEGD